LGLVKIFTIFALINQFLFEKRLAELFSKQEVQEPLSLPPVAEPLPQAERD